jgi:hypothetical protein
MSDTPTYANLITRLFTGVAADRVAVVAHLLAHPADAQAVEAAIRDHLRSKIGLTRLIAADAVVEVYGDAAAVVPAVVAVLRAGGIAWASAEAASLIRSVGAAVARVGGANEWKELFFSGPANAGPALLIGLAEAAPGAAHAIESVGPAIQHLLAAPELQIAAGAALWRLTWRVNQPWLATLDPGSEAMKYPGLRALIFEVLVEHLGRRPDLAGLVREMLAALAAAEPHAAEGAVARLVRLGSRGWGVLIPMLHPSRAGERFPVPDSVRRAILERAIGRPAVLPLVHHHAQGIIATAALEGSTNDLVPDAARVLKNLGPIAGMAVPDLLNLAVRVPVTGTVVSEVLPKIASGFPNTAAAVIRALNRIRTASYFGSNHLDAFQALARTLAELDLDAGPILAENTSLDSRVPDLLLQQDHWKQAPTEIRRRHALILADALASPRAEVRIRAAELLRHYADEMAAVWPALVAVLAGADEKAAIAVLPHFRHLAPVSEAVATELIGLFREKKPVYAARAVVALWRLGRMAVVGADLRDAVERDPEGGWGWAVLRGVVDRVSMAHRLLKDLNELFAAAPAAIAEKLNELLNVPESRAETEITRCVPRPDDPTAPATVDWDALHAAIGIGTEGMLAALLHIALMCEYGSDGFARQKIWLIKIHREFTRVGLAEAKNAVERTIAAVPRPGAPTADRRHAIRGFVVGKVELPAEIVEMLKHPVSWYRWAALELADAWELTPAQVKELTEDRVWDTSPRVRERALRMLRG